MCAMNNWPINATHVSLIYVSPTIIAVAVSVAFKNRVCLEFYTPEPGLRAFEQPASDQTKMHSSNLPSPTPNTIDPLKPVFRIIMRPNEWVSVTCPDRTGYGCILLPRITLFLPLLKNRMKNRVPELPEKFIKYGGSQRI